MSHRVTMSSQGELGVPEDPFGRFGRAGSSWDGFRSENWALQPGWGGVWWVMVPDASAIPNGRPLSKRRQPKPPRPNPDPYANLRKYQWKKGECPNPMGVTRVVTDLGKELRAILHETIKGSKERKTRLRWVIDRMMHTKPELILAYAYGRPLTTIDVRGASNATLNIALLPDDFSQTDMRELLASIQGMKTINGQNRPQIIDVGPAEPAGAPGPEEAVAGKSA